MRANFYRRLAVHLETGDPAFLAVVADHTRHSPGTRGAKMFVEPNGLQFGTVGGGVMEARIVEEAQRAFASSSAVDTETLHHREGAYGSPSGLICAGRQSMIYAVATGADLPIIRGFADAVDDEEEVELRVDASGFSVGPRPPDVNRGPIRFEDGASFSYCEHAVNFHRVAIVGGGHCGLALSRVLAQLGYHVTVFETRGDVYTFVDNEYADEKVVVPDYQEAAGLVHYAEFTHFVVMTAAYPSDVRALLGGLAGPFPYVGVMGSSAKLAAIREELAAEGMDPSGMYAPIGLEMTSNTPEEIAISVAAQILRERPTLFPWAKPSAM